VNELDTDTEPDTKVAVKDQKSNQVHDTNLPSKVGDSVMILNPGSFRTEEEVVCKVIKIGLRVTVFRPDRKKIGRRLVRNLRKVQ